jgi:hypothetical protein
MTIDWADRTEKKQLMFTLTLPDITDRVFHVVKDWEYDLETEGQCQAWVAAPGVIAFEREWKQSVWLRWDTKHNAMIVSAHRNWVEDNDSPLHRKNTEIPPLTFSFLTIIVGLLAQHEVSTYYSPHLLNQLIESEQIDEKIISAAMKILLQFPVVNPVKLVRALEKDIKLLPVLWPMLTECIRNAGALAAAGENPPVWVNRVLDIALRYAPYLMEAMKRGYIGADDAQWTGLLEIASAKAKSTAIVKAKKLSALLG